MSILRCEICGQHVDADFNLACVAGKPGACGLFEDVMMPCLYCHGTGAVDTPTSADDPSCPECDGEGKVAA